MRGFPAPKKLAALALLILVISAGALMLRSQQTREKKPPKPGTLRALVENPNITGDIRVGRHVEFPMYGDVATLAGASDAVVRGEVLLQRSYPCDDMTFVCTEFRFKVDEVLSGSIPENRRGTDRIPTFRPGIDARPERKGPELDQIVVTQAGGVFVMNGRRVVAYIVDQEMLRREKEYVLFLTWVPENAAISAGRETYHLTAGPQSAIALESERARSLVSPRFWSHPVRLEIEGPLQGNRELLLSDIKRNRK